jgi:hypothetical protein
MEGPLHAIIPAWVPRRDIIAAFLFDLTILQQTSPLLWFHERCQTDAPAARRSRKL